MDLLRKWDKEFSNKTDEELEAAEKELNNLPGVSEAVRVRNYMRLKELRANVFPEYSNKILLRGTERHFQWLYTCEWLFINGKYGPCCVWARATLEFWLQELCLSLNEIDEKIKKQIKGPGLNPSITELVGELKKIGIMSKEFYNHCDEIKKNGNVVVHIRLDELVSKDEIQTELGEWPEVCEKLCSDELFPQIQIGFMTKAWHNRARSSMEHLYAVERELYHLENPELSH